MKRLIVLLVVVVFAVGIAGCGLLGGGGGGSSAGGPVTVGTPVTGTFGTSLPTDDSGKPYIDYTLNVTTAGSYSIALVSSATESYDPYISLMQGTTQVASNDDGGDGLNSLLNHDLQPGDYTIRVTRFGSGQLETATSFTLTVTQAAAAVAPTPAAPTPPTPAPPAAPAAPAADPNAAAPAAPVAGGADGTAICQQAHRCCTAAFATQGLPPMYANNREQACAAVNGSNNADLCTTAMTSWRQMVSAIPGATVPADCNTN